MLTPASARCLCTLLLAAYVACAAGHGYLLEPASRNWVAHKEGRFWNEASGNGLGQGSAGNPGVCGDPFQTTTSNFAAEPSAVQATYRQGGTIDLRVVLTTNHGGKFTFRVCPRTDNLDEACFGDNYLTRVDNGQRDTWIMDLSSDFTMRYQLPPRVSCRAGCVLQWSYFSMQSCVEPGCDRKYCGVYADGDNAVYHSNPGFCGRTGAKAEYFNNCADIRIQPSGSTRQDAPTDGQLAQLTSTAADEAADKASARENP